jgi:hypothetical protein
VVEEVQCELLRILLLAGSKERILLHDLIHKTFNSNLSAFIFESKFKNILQSNEELDISIDRDDAHDEWCDVGKRPHHRNRVTEIMSLD